LRSRPVARVDAGLAAFGPGRTLALAAIIVGAMGAQANEAEALERAKRIEFDTERGAEDFIARNLRRRAEREVEAELLAPAIVSEEHHLPALEKRPGHRRGYQLAQPKGAGKPAGSKLFRKAKRGKL